MVSIALFTSESRLPLTVYLTVSSLDAQRLACKNIHQVNPALNAGFTWLIFAHDRPHNRQRTGSYRHEAQPCGRAPWPAPVRQDHSRAPLRSDGVPQLFRSGRPGEPGPPLRAGHRVTSVEATGRHRRNPTPSRPLSIAARAGGSSAAARAVSDSRQRFTGFVEKNFRNSRRPAGNHPAGGLPSGRSRSVDGNAALGARWFSTVLHRPYRI